MLSHGSKLGGAGRRDAATCDAINISRRRGMFTALPLRETSNPALAPNSSLSLARANSNHRQELIQEEPIPWWRPLEGFCALDDRRRPRNFTSARHERVEGRAAVEAGPVDEAAGPQNRSCALVDEPSIDAMASSRSTRINTAPRVADVETRIAPRAPATQISSMTCGTIHGARLSACGRELHRRLPEAPRRAPHS